MFKESVPKAPSYSELDNLLAKVLVSPNLGLSKSEVDFVREVFAEVEIEMIKGGFVDFSHDELKSENEREKKEHAERENRWYG